jgi:hypothetical protein
MSSQKAAAERTAREVVAEEPLKQVVNPTIERVVEGTSANGPTAAVSSSASSSITPVEPPPEPVLEGESPGIKRRQSRVDSSSTPTLPLPTKRVKADDATVKLLPPKYEDCEVEDIVVLIANMIGELISTNDSLPLRSGVLTRFHSR